MLNKHTPPIIQGLLYFLYEDNVFNFGVSNFGFFIFSYLNYFLIY